MLFRKASCPQQLGDLFETVVGRKLDGVVAPVPVSLVLNRADARTDVDEAASDSIGIVGFGSSASRRPKAFDLGSFESRALHSRSTGWGEQATTHIGIHRFGFDAEQIGYLLRGER